MAKNVVLRPLPTEDEETYQLTPKGEFFAWIIGGRTAIMDALINMEPFEAADELWPDIAKMFGLNSCGENEELLFLREYIYKHGMHFDAANEWRRVHGNMED